MKRIVVSLLILLSSTVAMAQEKLAFPFQGGSQVMANFFRDSLVVSPEINAARATGTVVFKFTADEKGAVQKIIVYYADDAILIKPIIQALQKSTRKWVIPDRVKLHDFILPFAINFNAPAKDDPKVKDAAYKFYKNRRAILSYDQVPLNTATLLPTVTVNYDLK